MLSARLVLDVNLEYFFDLYCLNIYNCLIFVNVIFFIGLLGIVFSIKNLIFTMLFIEVAYVAIFFHFLLSSVFLNSALGQLYALLLLIVAACESAIGLGLILLIYKHTGAVNYKNFTELRG